MSNLYILYGVLCVFLLMQNQFRSGFHCMFNLMLNLMDLICVSATWQCVLEEGCEANPQSSGPAETLTPAFTGDNDNLPLILQWILLTVLMLRVKRPSLMVNTSPDV